MLKENINIETEIYVLVHCVSVTFFIELVCHLKARYTYCVVEARSAVKVKVILHKSCDELSVPKVIFLQAAEFGG